MPGRRLQAADTPLPQYAYAFSLRYLAGTGFTLPPWHKSALTSTLALDVKYKNYADALEQIANNAAIAALLSDNEIMTITVAGPDKKQSAEILSGVEAYAAGQSNTYCYYASSEEVAQAHEMGFSCGKYKTFLELQQLNPDIDPEAVQEMTMREIRELIDHCSDDGGEDAPTHNPEENDHHGHGGGHQKGHGKGRRGRH